MWIEVLLLWWIRSSSRFSHAVWELRISEPMLASDVLQRINFLWSRIGASRIQGSRS